MKIFVDESIKSGSTILISWLEEGNKGQRLFLINSGRFEISPLPTDIVS